MSYELYADVFKADDYHDYCRTCWRAGRMPSGSKDGPVLWMKKVRAPALRMLKERLLVREAAVSPGEADTGQA
eukprot:9765430-Karenia_brevis.AAC.1